MLSGMSMVMIVFLRLRRLYHRMGCRAVMVILCHPGHRVLVDAAVSVISELFPEGH